MAKTQKVIVEIIAHDGDGETIDMQIRLDPPVPPPTQWESLPKGRKILIHMANDIMNNLKAIIQNGGKKEG